MSYPLASDDRRRETSAPDEAPPTASKRVAVLVDQVAEEEAAASDMAAPAQSTFRIIDALRSLGHEPVELALEASRTADWLRQLAHGEFDIAFNLCETVAGHADGEHLTAAAVELFDLPMTGASSATLLYCLNKDRCSAVLRAHGVPVPEWTLIAADEPVVQNWNHFPAILKPAAQDASNGVHPNSVVTSHDELIDVLEKHRASWGDMVLQEFIAGREINLAIVGRYLLPPAEIDFSTLPEGSPPIVSFEAKWVTGSPEDLGTVPVCPAHLPPEQSEQLQLLAARAWQVLDGSGYARIDIRLTADGAPYVIDVNPNPDLSIDAGLARQASVAGWSYEDLIKRIVDSATSWRDRSNGGSRGDWIFEPPSRANGEGPSPIDATPKSTAKTDGGFCWAPPTGAHRSQIVELLEETDAFRPNEVNVALEVFDNYCAAPGTDYWTIAALSESGELAGFAIYGPTPCTVDTWDLYWIAVRPRFQRAGVGRGLVERTERHVRSLGARICLIETSSRDDYSKTRNFYITCGYREVARVPDFYDVADDRVIYMKQFA